MQTPHRVPSIPDRPVFLETFQSYFFLTSGSKSQVKEWESERKDKSLNVSEIIRWNCWCAGAYTLIGVLWFPPSVHKDACLDRLDTRLPPGVSECVSSDGLEACSRCSPRDRYQRTQQDTLCFHKNNFLIQWRSSRKHSIHGIVSRPNTASAAWSVFTKKTSLCTERAQGQSSIQSRCYSTPLCRATLPARRRPLSWGEKARQLDNSITCP